MTSRTRIRQLSRVLQDARSRYRDWKRWSQAANRQRRHQRAPIVALSAIRHAQMQMHENVRQRVAAEFDVTMPRAHRFNAMGIIAGEGRARVSRRPAGRVEQRSFSSEISKKISAPRPSLRPSLTVSRCTRTVARSLRKQPGGRCFRKLARSLARSGSRAVSARPAFCAPACKVHSMFAVRFHGNNPLQTKCIVCTRRVRGDSPCRDHPPRV